MDQRQKQQSQTNNLNQSQQNLQQTSIKIKDKLKKAYEHFHKNQYTQALDIYKQIIEIPQIPNQLLLQCLKNRCSLYLTMGNPKDSINDIETYLKHIKQIPSPQIYVLYLTALMKDKQFKKSLQIAAKALQQYPLHKKLQQLSKTLKQKQIANDEQLYVECMFEKLCTHPKIRQYLKDQSFLTKVQRLIRNPTLGPVLAKIDPRITEAEDFMMMAEYS